jgi:hypothetical protein
MSRTSGLLGSWQLAAYEPGTASCQTSNRPKQHCCQTKTLDFIIHPPLDDNSLATGLLRLTDSLLLARECLCPVLCRSLPSFPFLPQPIPHRHTTSQTWPPFTSAKRPHHTATALPPSLIPAPPTSRRCHGSVPAAVRSFPADGNLQLS